MSRKFKNAEDSGRLARVRIAGIIDELLIGSAMFHHRAAS
jgi:hypothetical protein